MHYWKQIAIFKGQALLTAHPKLLWLSSPLSTAATPAHASSPSRSIRAYCRHLLIRTLDLRFYKIDRRIGMKI